MAAASSALLLLARAASHLSASTSLGSVPPLGAAAAALGATTTRRWLSAGPADSSGSGSGSGPAAPSGAPLPKQPAEGAASQPDGSAARRQRQRLPPSVLSDLRPPARPYQLLSGVAQRPTPTPAQYVPWTPTRLLQRRAKLARRMGFLMQVLEQERTNQAQRARPLPEFRAGDVLEVRVLVPEVERKEVVYRGVCIARYDKGVRSAFKLYNVYPETGGVVQHFPLYMPDLLDVKVVGKVPVKQERLYYMTQIETREHTYQTTVGMSSSK